MAGELITARATARGFYRGQRYRAGQTLLLRPGDQPQEWMELLTPEKADEAPPPKNRTTGADPVPLSEAAPETAKGPAKKKGKKPKKTKEAKKAAEAERQEEPESKEPEQ